MAEQESNSNFTPREVDQLVMALNCLKEGPLKNAMFDIPAFATKAGISAGGAKNILIKLRKKIDEGGEPDKTHSSAVEGKAKKDPAKEAPAKRKKKTLRPENKADQEEGEDELW